ncbi:hypothetical protein BU24DRAFT_415734 [Aaosphaeria arxii CBS 175.79]|uniref:Uncharacterized protein n=1 Tax=Aaosphaeria arxii CBS 175.79 TaxID=1450172 RepID=A0A6A5X6Z9_9PLEO|nr:uncharacterized protein BU24DRAFT_415734 [Aaosphaeria arxii CBS 175.79]KAF2008682.1 hypothetical protein BU24DRAFT_415734 [Aaosphaeria arxii CBS 175.79]
MQPCTLLNDESSQISQHDDVDSEARSSQHQDTPATTGTPVKPANSDAALKPPFDSILLVREQRNHVPPVAEQPAPEQDQTHPTEPTRTPPTTTALIRTDEIILTLYDLPGIEPADPDNPPPGKFIVSYTKVLDPPEVHGDKLIVSRTFHVSAHDDSEDAGRAVRRVAKELTPEGGAGCEREGSRRGGEELALSSGQGGTDYGGAVEGVCPSCGVGGRCWAGSEGQ